MIPFFNLKAITEQHAAEYKAAVNRVIDSGWFLQGAEVHQFEEQYAAYTGTRHCIGVGNGLDALRLMLRACIELGQLAPGDEVIVPANTFIATILAITDNHLTPVLVEPSEHTLNLDAALAEKAITPRTRAIMTVHLYGRLGCSEQLLRVCEQHGLLLFEDNAQSHGCLMGNTRTGALGYAAAHSFYPGKNLGAFGDAGAVTTNSDKLAAVIRSLANYGSERKYVFQYQGLNSRLSEMDAAVLGVKLRYLEHDNAQRRRLAAYYYEHITNPLVQLPHRLPDAENVYHQFPVFCARRDALQQHLEHCGVQTLIHYPLPPHKQACYARWNELSLPLTERLAQQELSLPMSQAVTTEQAEHIVAAVNSFR